MVFSRTALLISARSWQTMRPAPMLRCPTSLLPICPSGRPTSSPDVRSVLCGYFLYKLSTKGVFALAIASDFEPSPIPQPSRIINTAFFMGTNNEYLPIYMFIVACHFERREKSHLCE